MMQKGPKSYCHISYASGMYLDCFGNVSIISCIRVFETIMIFILLLLIEHFAW